VKKVVYVTVVGKLFLRSRNKKRRIRFELDKAVNLILIKKKNKYKLKSRNRTFLSHLRRRTEK